MIDYLIHFFTYNKIYLVTGAVLLPLLILPTKERIFAKTRKTLYLGAVIWIICFAYRITTGQDIVCLFKNEDDFGSESKPFQLEASPFYKYYSNEAGRKPQNQKF